MAHKEVFIVLPMVSLILSGFTDAFAQEPEQGGGLSWIWVLIVLILLIPLVWWLIRSSGSTVEADHSHHAAESQAPAYPVETTKAIDLEPVDPAPIRTEEVAAGAQQVVQNVVNEISDTADAGEAELEAIAPKPEKVELNLATDGNESRSLQPTHELPTKPDDLTIIEGIGPKISRILQDSGIKTFADLAGADLNQVEGILREAGLSNIANPGTWAEQAQLAAAGNWAELEALQDTLKSGRRA